MNKLKNKIFSSILVVLTLFNMFSPIMAMAAENIPDNEPEYETVQMDNVDVKGNIELEMHLVLPIHNSAKNNMSFAIYDASNNKASVDLNEVNNPSYGGYYEQTLNLGSNTIRAVVTKRDKDGGLLSGSDVNQNVVYVSVNLYSLSKGTYTLEFSGKNFVTYQTQVTIDNFSKRINLTNGAGLFEIGDINADGKVDHSDYDLMLQSLGSDKLENDLNLDGKVDIADLNYITAMLTSPKGSKKEENTSAIINNSDTSFEVPVGSLVSGSNLSNLFTDDGVVSLKQVDDKPIELGIDLSGELEDKYVEMSEVRVALGDNTPASLKFYVETLDGEKFCVDTYGDSCVIPVENSEENEFQLFTDSPTEGVIKIDLGKQVAVKKVIIEMIPEAGNNLADIAKVEFLNNVKTKTKEPDNFYTPQNIKLDTSVSEQITVSYDAVPNVTGYEIKVVGDKMAQGGTVFETTFTNFTVEDLKNYAEYTFYVCAVNQEWRSKEGVAKATPMPTRKPPAVDDVFASATYSGINFKWKNMDDTSSYNIYYREVGSEEWLKVSDIKGTSYSLKGLKASVKYEAYITGNNHLGEGDKSQTVEATTLKVEATITPKYKLINTYDENTNRTSHIKDVIYSAGKMVDGDKFSIVDDNYLTYWNHDDWTTVLDYGANNGMPIVILDDEYEIDEFVITVSDAYKYEYKMGGSNDDTIVYYFQTEEDAKARKNYQQVKGTLTKTKDKNDRIYYVLKTLKPVKARAFAFGMTVVANNSNIQIDEIKFYHYDSLVDDVANLFLDEMRVELKENVTHETIEELRNRANTKDNGEYSPYRNSVLADLDYADKILNDEKLNDVIVLNPKVSNAYNGHLKFAMTINDYQPLGIVAKEGDTLNVYVGSTGKVNIELVYTQYFAQPSAWSKTYALKAGQNIIKIDAIGSGSDERGGSVYVRYKDMPDANNLIKVRVSGGTKIPVLDTSTLTSETEKKEAIKSYIKNLEDYNSKLESIYSKEGKSFNNATSVLASTEIVTKHGLFSVSSIAVLNALNENSKTIDDKVLRLYESNEAFDEMMEMFYRQKGLSENPTDAKDKMPQSRINIRYMRMFDGAFMYAGGFHIGIGYGSIAGLVQASRQTNSKTGYFGWGISHEVGHQINQSDIVFAEVTNNVYALLAQTSNDSDKSRLETSGIYDKIYEKVTSHTKGRSQNVFVQLGMYWQLHLYYDNLKTFDDPNSIYAKINHESRTYENKNGYNKDDLLILYASKAANKNLIDFFKEWGLIASEKVTEEINSLNLDKETKPLYYLNDAARRYRLNGGSAISNNVKVDASILESDSQTKTVTLSLNVTGESDKILGYEILRNGTPIAFVLGNEKQYVDNIGSENNRAYTYSVVAYDYLLNKTEQKVLDEIKIVHDGSISKNNFIIESNVKDKDEVIDYEDEDMDLSKLEVNKLIDGNKNTYFNGTVKYSKLTSDGTFVTDRESPFVIIDLNSNLSVSGIKYRAAIDNGKMLANTITDYKVYVSSDKVNWTLARTGKFDLNEQNDYTNIIYLMGQNTTSETQLWTYSGVSYVKIEAVGNKNGLSGSEIDIIAPPGDNVDIDLLDNLEPSITVLESDYCYLRDGCDKTKLDENGDVVGVIKEGSVLIQGKYRGNPAFNHVLIADADNYQNVYSGYFLIFAELNDDDSVYDVAEGSWIYVMSKEQYENMLSKTSNKQIRAYLYRVDDAISLEGQRLASTSMAFGSLKAYKDLKKSQITSTLSN